MSLVGKFTNLTIQRDPPGHNREFQKPFLSREMTAPGHYSNLPPAGCRPWSCTHTRQGGTGGRAPVQLLLGPLGLIFVYYESTTI